MLQGVGSVSEGTVSNVAGPRMQLSGRAPALRVPEKPKNPLKTLKRVATAWPLATCSNDSDHLDLSPALFVGPGLLRLSPFSVPGTGSV